MNAGQRADAHTQEKAAHRQKVTYEQCPGYTDRFGIWNNGFNCPRWSGQDEIYCCGDASERFCCPPPTQDVATLFDNSDAINTPTPSTIRFPVVFMVVTGAGLLLLILSITFIILCCCLCRCCPGYRGGRKFRSKATPRNGRAEFVNMEAAETSAAIEAQALSPPGINSVLSGCSVQASPHLAVVDRRHWTPNGNDCCTASTYRIKRHQTGSSTDDDDLHSVSTICVDLQATPRSPRGYDDRDQIRKSTHLDYHVISADGKDRSIDSPSSPRLCLETFRPLTRCSEANTTPGSIGCRHSNRKKVPNLQYQQQHHHHHHHRHPQHNFDLIESIND